MLRRSRNCDRSHPCVCSPSIPRLRPAPPPCSTPSTARWRANRVPMVRGHAEALMPLIDRVMKQAGVPFAALDRIAVTTGPGSFTGLRVGISAARGIALAASKPAIGLTTLAAYAAPYIAHDDKTAVAVAIDARHQHVYLQVFGAGRPHAGRAAHRQPSPTRRAPPRSGRCGSSAPARPCWRRHGRRASLRRCWSTTAARRTSSGSARLAVAADEGASRAEAALSPRARRAAAGRREAAAPMIAMVARLFARGEPALSEASRARRRGDRDAARRVVPARLERRRDRADAARPQHRRPPRHDRPRAARLHPVAARRRRGGNPFGRGRARRGAAAGSRARCSTCICGGWPGLAPRRCSWRSTRTTRRRGGSTSAPVSARSGGGRAITSRAATSLRPRWCCAAIWCELR